MSWRGEPGTDVLSDAGPFFRCVQASVGRWYDSCVSEGNGPAASALIPLLIDVCYHPGTPWD